MSWFAWFLYFLVFKGLIRRGRRAGPANVKSIHGCRIGLYRYAAGEGKKVLDAVSDMGGESESVVRKWYDRACIQRKTLAPKFRKRRKVQGAPYEG